MVVPDTTAGVWIDDAVSHGWSRENAERLVEVAARLEECDPGDVAVGGSSFCLSYCDGCSQPIISGILAAEAGIPAPETYWHDGGDTLCAACEQGDPGHDAYHRDVDHGKQISREYVRENYSPWQRRGIHEAFDKIQRNGHLECGRVEAGVACEQAALWQDLSRWEDFFAQERHPVDFLTQAVIEPVGRCPEGLIVEARAIPFKVIAEQLGRDWSLAFQIDCRKWEELVAAAFKAAGYDEVILTPRSSDHGRDVIAIRRGVGCIRLIGSVKAYKPGHLVSYDDVRALSGVLHGDLNATKGILTTTSDFPPGLSNDPFIGPLIPYRLELMPGAALRRWLNELAGTGSSAGETQL